MVAVVAMIDHPPPSARPAPLHICRAAWRTSSCLWRRLCCTSRLAGRPISASDYLPMRRGGHVPQEIEAYLPPLLLIASLFTPRLQKHETPFYVQACIVTFDQILAFVVSAHQPASANLHLTLVSANSAVLGRGQKVPHQCQLVPFCSMCRDP